MSPSRPPSSSPAPATPLTEAVERLPLELARTTLAVLALSALLAAALRVLWPFMGAVLWAAMIVVATWPMLIGLERRLGGRRGLAVAVMTVLLVLVLVVPLTVIIDALIDNVPRLATIFRNLTTAPLPPPPSWVADLPLVGHPLAEFWSGVASSGLGELAQHAAPYAGTVSRWAFSQVGSLGFVLVHFLLTVAIAAVLYADGEKAARLLLRVGRRLAGTQGEGAVRLAGQAIRGVALGVGVTAIVQAVLTGIGLGIAGVPLAVLFTGVTLMLCIAQIGPAPVLLPAIGWLYFEGDNGLATFLVIWSVVVLSLDNVLRPILIRRGADLPLLLIFAGVIGGLLAFGLVGIFVGPVVLAVGYTLLEAWLADAPPGRHHSDSPAAAATAQGERP